MPSAQMYEVVFIFPIALLPRLVFDTPDLLEPQDISRPQSGSLRAENGFQSFAEITGGYALQVEAWDQSLIHSGTRRMNAGRIPLVNR